MIDTSIEEKAKSGLAQRTSEYVNLPVLRRDGRWVLELLEEGNVPSAASKFLCPTHVRIANAMSFFVRKTSKWRPIPGPSMTKTLPKSYRVRDGLVPVGVTHRRRRRRGSRRRRMRNRRRWRRRRRWRWRMLAAEVPVDRGRQGRPWGRWGWRRSVSIGVSRRGRRARIGTDGWNRE